MLTEKEEAIMHEAFMTGRIYAASGEKETPVEIFQKLKTNCERASRPFEGVVIKLGAELFQFDDYENWCDTAKRKFKKANKHSNDVICLDTQNRICGWGEHFMKARDENAFPIKCYAIR